MDIQKYISGYYAGMGYGSFEARRALMVYLQNMESEPLPDGFNQTMYNAFVEEFNENLATDMMIFGRSVFDRMKHDILTDLKKDLGAYLSKK